MSMAPVKLTDNTVENSVVLEIPEKNDFIGRSTHKQKKSEIVDKQNKQRFDNTLTNQIQEKDYHRHVSIKPVNPKTSASVSHSHHLKTSQSSQRPYTFSLSGISLSSHTHSPKTTVPHSVKPTIKPTLGVPVHQETNKAAQHSSTHQTHSKQTSLSQRQPMQNSLSKQPSMKNTLTKHQYTKNINTDHQHSSNTRIKYLPLKNSLTDLKSESKFSKPPSRDYVYRSSSLTSFNPRKSTLAYQTVGHNFDINDKFTTKYTHPPHTGHSSVSHTATTTPSSRIVVYTPATSNWQHKSSLPSHMSGKIGHYKKQFVIESQNGVSFSDHNQLQIHPNHVDRSIPSAGKQSTYKIARFEQLSGQRPSTKTSPNTIENTINHSKSWNDQNLLKTIDNSKQWSNKILASKPQNAKMDYQLTKPVASKPLNVKKDYQNQITKPVVSKPLNARKDYQNKLSMPAGLLGYAISGPVDSEAKHSRQIIRPTSRPDSHTKHRTSVNLKDTKIQHIIENKINSGRQSGWVTPQPLKPPRYGAVNKIQTSLRQQTKPNIRYQQHHQHQQGHRSVVKTQQHGHRTVESTLQQPIQAVTPPTHKHSPQMTLSVTSRPPLSVTQKSIETTKVAFFSTGTESYAISPQLLALLRQLPVGDLPDHKKRRLETILGVENGQLEEKSPEPLSEVDALNNAVHEQSIKNGKARQFEVSHQKLTSNNRHYVQPTFNGANNENVKSSLSAFFAP